MSIASKIATLSAVTTVVAITSWMLGMHPVQAPEPATLTATLGGNSSVNPIASATYDSNGLATVAFRFPFGSPDLAIKRAVALPGDCMPLPVGGPGADRGTAACDPVPPGSVFI